MKHKFSKVFFVVVALLVVCLLAVACNPDGQDNDNNPVKYAVSYVGGDGATGAAPNGGEYVEGAKYTLPDAGSLSKTDNTFGGWSYGGQTYAVGAEFTMPAQAVVFTAVWNPISTTKYTVTFDPNNEGETWTETVVSGQKVAKPATDPTIEGGKLFRYWANGGVAFNFDTPITSDITLEAEYGWKVTFNAGEGASGTVEPVWTKVWGSVVLPDGTGLSNFQRLD